MRVFQTGATRDADEGKPEYSGFNSPLVEKRFGAYMHAHRKQADGQVRSAGNWKKGIPREAYQESLHRHFIDLWLHGDGFPEEATESDIENVLCALRFNVNGMLHEVLKGTCVRTVQCTDRPAEDQSPMYDLDRLNAEEAARPVSHPGFEQSAVEWLREHHKEQIVKQAKELGVLKPYPSDVHSPSAP